MTKLSLNFMDWFLKLAGEISFEAYAQLVYWDLYFKAYKILSDDQRDVAKKLVQTRLLSGIVSLAYPVERVFSRTVEKGAVVTIVWDNHAVTSADVPTEAAFENWLESDVVYELLKGEGSNAGQIR